MKKYIIILFSLFVFQNISYSQETLTVEKSSLIETIDGIKFYVHVVKPGQTLYSISKAYEVSIDDIYKYNPDSKSGIKPEQIIKIPKLSKKEKKEMEKEAGFIYHTVVSKETIYSISKKYNVTEIEIYFHNPKAKEGLHPDDILKIPERSKELGAAVTISNEENPEPNDSIIYHTIKRKETFYSLTKLYNVSHSDLIKWNPELSDGLKKDQVIKIHIKSAKKPEIEKIEEEVVNKETKAEENIKIISDCKNSRKKSSYNVAILLPLYLYEIDDINVETEMDIPKPSEFRSFNYIQFYEGIIIAVDSLKKLGLSVKLYVYDTKKDSTQTSKIIQKPIFKEMDLIIGPLYTKNFKIVADFAQDNKIKIINPFSSKIDLSKSYSHVIKIMPTLKSTYNQISEFIIDSFPGSTVLVVHNGNPKDSIFLDNVTTIFNENFKENQKINFKIINYKDGGFASLQSNFSKTENNIIITLINNETFISSYLTALNKIRDNYKLIIFGSEEWTEFRVVEIDHLNNLNLHVYDNFFVDYQDEDVKNFVRRFREKYETEPNSLAFQGYDIGFYFLTALMKYGVDFENCFSEIKVKTLQNDYDFRQLSGDCCFQNQYINIYRFKDYKAVNMRRLPKQKTIPEVIKDIDKETENETE
ncbi:MAG: LysM peptidoglycan-binding domain-containing protein [Saprospiraceae bacterium]|nr:LysM peptidoglycan-binding domain-containing protein [Saprospiraceae bacterium]